jgi:hypothetical protein
MRFFFIILIFFISNLSFAEDYGFSEYESVSEIPEPLVFDLVRPLGAKKGELEINALVRSEKQYGFEELHVSPEIEYVFAKNLAFELEAPMIGSKPDSIKTTLQWTIGFSGKKKQMVNGIQLMTERYVMNTFHNEVTPLFIHGHRLSLDWSYLSMFGAQYTDLQYQHSLIPVMNFTLFYVYSHSREIEFGLEHNLLGIGETFKYYRIVPQLEIIFHNHWKMQYGFGGLFANHEWQTTTDFRVICEFF